MVSCVRRTCASASGPTRTPACGGEPRTPGVLPRPQATCVPNLSTRAEGHHAPVCPRSRAPRGPCGRLTAPAHPCTAMLEHSIAREYSFSHTAGIPRPRRARGSDFPKASHPRCTRKPCGRVRVRAHGCPCDHVLSGPCTHSTRRHTAHDQHRPRPVWCMRHTAGAPHRRRATPPARHTAHGYARRRCLRCVHLPACVERSKTNYAT